MELHQETEFWTLVSSQISISIVIYLLRWCSQVKFRLKMNPVALSVYLKTSKDVLSLTSEI